MHSLFCLTPFGESFFLWKESSLYYYHFTSMKCFPEDFRYFCICPLQKHTLYVYIMLQGVMQKMGIFKFWFCRNGVCPNIFPEFSSAVRAPLSEFSSCWKPFPWEKMVSIGRYYHGKHCHIMAIIGKIGSTSGSFMVYITPPQHGSESLEFQRP